MIPDSKVAFYASNIEEQLENDGVEERKESITNNLKEFRLDGKKTCLPDDVLDALGPRNMVLLIAIFSFSFIWALGAMPLMASSFTTDTNNSTMITLVTDFELYGDRSYLADMTTSVYMGGNMVGGTVLTQASDRLGRRPVLIAALLFFSLTGIASSFSESVFVFIVFRFFQGCFYTGSTLIGWVAGYESSPTKLRPLTTLLFGLGWLLGYCAVAPLAMISTSWRHLVMATALPTLLFAVWAYFTIPETLHFLVTKGDAKRIDKWIQQMSKGRPLNISAEQILNEKNEDEDDDLRVNVFREIWSHKIFVLYCVVVVYLWVCDTFIYFGLSLYSTQLSGNKYLNYIMMGLVELPAYIFAPMSIDRYGRRPVVAGSHLLAAAAFLTLPWVPDNATIRLSIWLVGKFAISLSFMAIFVYSSEIFPTSIRNASVGLCVVLARFGGIAAPQLKILATISASLPEILLGIISLVGGFVTFLLPETLNKPLPNTIKQSTNTLKGTSPK